jgi:hypothetical protein
MTDTTNTQTIDRLSQATQDFRAWVKGYSGFQGGDSGEKRIWFCGIEYGGVPKLADLKKASKDIPSEIPNENEDKCKKSMTFQYNRKLWKILKGPLEIQHDYQLFGKGSGFLKLNLFPLDFKKDSGPLMQEDLVEFTGFATKAVYRAWCILNRFPQMHRLCVDKNPKVVVGTSTVHLLNFVLAFSGQAEIHKKMENLSSSQRYFPNTDPAKRKKYIYHLKINETEGKDTLLIVVPFLGGQSGLNADKELEQLGAVIEEYCDPKKTSGNFEEILKRRNFGKKP